MKWMDRLKTHQGGSVSIGSDHKSHFSTFLSDNHGNAPFKKEIRPETELPILTKPLPLSKDYTQTDTGTGRKHVKPSPLALSWLLEHRQELKQTGWTAGELYRCNKSKGIIWLRQWSNPNVEVSLRSDGSIVFLFKDRGVTQTARPRKPITRTTGKYSPKPYTRRLPLK